MMNNNPKLYLVNVNVYTKFGQILPIHSQDIERKRNSDIYQCKSVACVYKIWSNSVLSFSILSRIEILTSIKGHNSVSNLQKMTINNPNLDLVNVNV